MGVANVATNWHWQDALTVTEIRWITLNLTLALVMLVLTALMGISLVDLFVLPDLLDFIAIL